jgi:hypothetical protein
MSLEVADFIAEVVQATALPEKVDDRRIGGCWFDELDLRIHRTWVLKKTHPDFLRRIMDYLRIPTDPK